MKSVYEQAVFENALTDVILRLRMVLKNRLSRPPSAFCKILQHPDTCNSSEKNNANSDSERMQVGLKRTFEVKISKIALSPRVALFSSSPQHDQNFVHLVTFGCKKLGPGSFPISDQSLDQMEIRHSHLGDLEMSKNAPA